ncbi:MAG: hypothetical protein ACKOUM_03350 [Sphingopyxis sp.]
MTHWDYVIAAYGVTGFGTMAVLLHSWRAMRVAERAADALLSGRRPSSSTAGPPANPLVDAG